MLCWSRGNRPRQENELPIGTRPWGRWQAKPQPSRVSQNRGCPNLAGAQGRKLSFQIQLSDKLFGSLLSPPALGLRRQASGPRRYLDVVSDEEPSQVVHLQHCGRVVVDDAVALQDVLGPRDLPGQPAEVEGRIAGQQVGQVARLAAAAAPVVLVALRDGFHLPLLAVGSWQSTSSGSYSEKPEGDLRLEATDSLTGGKVLKRGQGAHSILRADGTPT